MPVTADDLGRRIEDALAWRADRTTVTVDTVFTGPRASSASGAAPRGVASRVILAAAAAALVVAGVAALAVERAGAPTDDGAAGAVPTTSAVGVPGSATAGTDTGYLGLPADSPFTVVDAQVTEVVGSNTRVYATDDPRPESGPALVVIGQSWEPPGPPTPDGAIEVAVGDATGWLFDAGGRKRLMVYADEYLYQFAAFNLTNAQLLAAAESAAPSPDGDGAVVDASTLGPGVSEQFVGWSESIFGTSPAPIRATTFADDSGGEATLLLFDDPGLVRIDRLGSFDEITDVTLGGRPGFVGSFEAGDDVVVWTTAAGTATLSSNGMASENLVALADVLVPISADEWDALVARFAAPDTCAPVGTYTIETTCVPELTPPATPG